MSPSSRIFSASWITNNQILILLSNDWLLMDQLPIFQLNGSIENIQLKPAPLIIFGELTGYYIDKDKITFIYFPNKEEENKRIYLAGNFNGWQNAIGNERWLLELHTKNNRKIMTLSCPWDQISESHSQLFFKFVTEDNLWLNVPLHAPNLNIDINNNSNYEILRNFTGRNAFILESNLGYDPSFNYSIILNENNEYETKKIDDIELLSTLRSTKKLGAVVDSKLTTFRLFAPRATSVQVFFYSPETPNVITPIELKRSSDYTWEATWPSNLHGYHYYYNVSKEEINETPILDPYALACYGPAGPGIIIDQKLIPKVKSTFKTPKWSNLIILEAHLRDLIASTSFVDPLEKPAGFQNFIDWFKSDNNYIKELGINAIEFLPIQEFQRDNPFEYHWGYMPTNYFCPSSSYSFGENIISQVTDFQNLVTTLHEHKIAVILDVVYNHSGSPNHLMNIDRDYYFVTDKGGNLSNWSGCGNDFKANTPMGKRLIIDSLVYFIKTFNVDGFRFDLAELLGIPVLEEIEKELKAVKPSIILIAEPWSFRGHIAHALRDTGFASWNDGYREFIYEYVHGRSNKESFRYFVSGSENLARFPTQSVNYASSHDDYCWIDKITENPHHNGSNPTVNDIRRTHLMIAILMMSIGIPMLAEGQDFLHSKQGHFNTYNNEYANTLHYINLSRYSNTHQYFTKWIKFRLSGKGKCLCINKMPSPDYFKFFYSESTTIGILYNNNLLFIINPNIEKNILLVEGLNSKDFLQIADQDRFDANGLKGALISWENNEVTLPSLSCGLWIRK